MDMKKFDDAIEVILARIRATTKELEAVHYTQAVANLVNNL